MIRSADDVLEPFERVVEKKSAVDPAVAALPVLDPTLHALDLVE
jgi:hypothetical protein